MTPIRRVVASTVGDDDVPPGASVSLALEVGRPDAPAGRRETGIRFTVPDAAAEHDALVAKGVAVDELLRWPGVPAMFAFSDPDGNRFVVVEDAR